MGLRSTSSIFFITAISRLPESGGVDVRPYGWYADRQSAVEAVSDNQVDMHDGQYEYMVIQELGQGVRRPHLSLQWFRWEPNGEFYLPITSPLPARPKLSKMRKLIYADG